jgi:hypothetical protein
MLAPPMVGRLRWVRGSAMVVTQEMLQEYLALVRRRYGVEVVEKTTSRLMRMLAPLLFFNKTFLTGYITTIGATIYWPNVEQMYMHPDQAFETLFHEVQHAADYRWCPSIFVVTYLVPQICALLAIGAVLAAVLNPWWLLWLLALLFLLPLPAVGRAIWEMRATSSSMALNLWKYGEQTISEKRMSGLVARFTGPDYYFMLPSRKLVEWLAYRYLGKVNETHGTHTTVQGVTLAFLQRHGLKG